MLGIETTKQVSRDPLRGHLMENLVILELMKCRLNQGLDPHLYYYRDVQKNEVDVIFKTGNDLIPIEIKSSKTFNFEFLNTIQFFQKLTKNRSSKGYIIYAGNKNSRFIPLNF